LLIDSTMQHLVALVKDACNETLLSIFLCTLFLLRHVLCLSHFRAPHQAILLAIVIYLSMQEPEVRRLAICPYDNPIKPFTGCVSFKQYINIVVNHAPVPDLS
jgi:hypothetical protein